MFMLVGATLEEGGSSQGPAAAVRPALVDVNTHTLLVAVVILTLWNGPFSSVTNGILIVTCWGGEGGAATRVRWIL